MGIQKIVASSTLSQQGGKRGLHEVTDKTTMQESKSILIDAVDTE